jgi:hypothetical protein
MGFASAEWFLMDTTQNIDLFLDSGAFSAANQGYVIDIQEYINFIERHKDSLTCYANLDVIGDPTKGIDGAEETLKNQQAMEAAGLTPMPVFHVGEDESYLRYYVENYEYVGLGGMVPFSTQVLRTWLDRVFRELVCDAKGWPQVKIHGFGMTSLSLMLRYPWYSVDSTSWIMASRNGTIYVPRYRAGQWIYDENSWKVAVSAKSASKAEAGKHYDTMSPTRRALIRDYVESKGYAMGESRWDKWVPQDYQLAENERWASKKPSDPNEKRQVEVVLEYGVRNDYSMRDELNVEYFIDLEEHFPHWPWPMDMGVQSTGFGL